MNIDNDERSKEKTPEGAFSETLRLNRTVSVAEVRRILLDLLTEYRQLEKPANPELLKLHIEAYEDRIMDMFAAQRQALRDEIGAKVKQLPTWENSTMVEAYDVLEAISTIFEGKAGDERES